MFLELFHFLAPGLKREFMIQLVTRDIVPRERLEIISFSVQICLILILLPNKESWGFPRGPWGFAKSDLGLFYSKPPKAEHRRSSALEAVTSGVTRLYWAESLAEAEYCEWWCREHKIVFRKRRIDEVTRGETKRDEYERVSRELRRSARLSDTPA